MHGPVPDDVLAEVATAAAADAGGEPVELLGDFLAVLSRAVVAGTPIPHAQLRTYRKVGDHAAQRGIALRALLDLYLSAAWRLWRHLPPVRDARRRPHGVVVAGEVMLHAVDDVVAALTEGFQLARRALVRAQESARREFIDDLLTGAADVVAVVQRAAGFGLDLTGPHAVATVTAARPFDDASPLLPVIERAILGSKGDSGALLASRQGRLVVVFAAPDQAATAHVLDQVARALDRAGRRTSVGAWRIAVGRAAAGADGVAASYRDCLDALLLAERLELDARVISWRDLRAYQVLLRDRIALAALVEDTLAPLAAARGGAAPLIDTLWSYFNAGGTAARTARELHLSVRAVTYRLDRVRRLTGLDPDDGRDRFALQLAVLGARMLDWPPPALLPDSGNEAPTI